MQCNVMQWNKPGTQRVYKAHVGTCTDTHALVCTHTHTKAHVPQTHRIIKKFDIIKKLDLLQKVWWGEFLTDESIRLYRLLLQMKREKCEQRHDRVSNMHIWHGHAFYVFFLIQVLRIPSNNYYFFAFSIKRNISWKYVRKQIQFPMPSENR